MLHRIERRTPRGGVSILTSFSSLLGIALIAATTAAQNPAARPRDAEGRFRFTGFVSETYDNNILNYSDSDRVLFRNNPTGTSSRFALKSLDDFVTEMGAHATYESSRDRASRWVLHARGSVSLFGRNGYRNYSQWGFDVRKNLGKTYARFSLGWIPWYNLRNLYWQKQLRGADPRKYMPAEFSRVSFGFELGRAFTREFDGFVRITVVPTNYKSPFHERDNTTVTESVRLGYDVSRRVSLYGGVGFDQSRAKGRDSTRFSGLYLMFFDRVADVSYNATNVEVGAKVKCDRRGKIVAAGSFEYQDQRYRSRKQYGDPGHYKRVDHDALVDLSLSWRVTPRWQPEVSYSYHSVKSNVEPSATDFGTYKTYHIGAQLTAYF